MITIFPCGSQRSKVLQHIFPATFGRGAGDPQTCPKFCLQQMAIPTQNSTTQRVGSGCTFPPNIFAPTPKIAPKPHFGGPFGANPIIERALHESHVNGATKLKRYSYIGIGKYFWVCQNVSARGHPEGAGPLNVNLELPLLSRKLLELES